VTQCGFFPYDGGGALDAPGNSVHRRAVCVPFRKMMNEQR